MKKSFYTLGNLSVELEDTVYEKMFTSEELERMSHGDPVEWTDPQGEVHSVRMLIKATEKKETKAKKAKSKKK